MNKFDHDNRDIRCRFAPSPTGYLHLGGARTALFNYLFAKASKGKYILRIEDTDHDRNSPEAVQAIIDGLAWLGITHDEGPFFQSERIAIYKDAARRLLEHGHAYRCYATAAEIEELRNIQRAKGLKTGYDNRYRPNSIKPQPRELPDEDSSRPFVIRLRIPDTETITFRDLVLGNIVTPSTELEDFIIIRSDGTPTYNFTVVVDDIDMRISHVIRGSDHVSNTPKQVAIYHGLSAPLPLFAHVPMILGSDKQKLSKRHGATSVVEYRKDGYLADAFINYLVRLGWSHGDQELFTRSELEQLFDLGSIGRSAAVFDFAKLRWVNAEHMKRLSPSQLSHACKDFIPSEFASSRLANSEGFSRLLQIWCPRASTLKELVDGCLWFLSEDTSLSLDDKHKSLFTTHIRPAYDSLLTRIDENNSFTASAIEELFKEVLSEYSLAMGKLAQPVRLALSGTLASPPLFDIFELLGKERTLARLLTAQKYFSKD